ncbi:transglycosylase family protein [Streptomyces chryseus]|uniref:transglycosylase family protein n=1 Tax=Streptomyces chryseus TaxID=68186 RepID=UPI00110F7FB8|nr:transglycosylase family protein [Streptomyces chryseus]GGX22606.1 peptidoglycan-binding protein LysM [Streptomyces chryseus]
MRSGNGRHRRPRQAPALVVAAGVTGSAIAIPLLGASGAAAADATTWDRVADCESGGMWSADLGNGYYGGLQFSPETWQKFGGTAYAPRADLASRSQQIQVAEKVLAEQGPAAWPSCALISGLTEGDDDAPADGSAAGSENDAPATAKSESPDAPKSAEAPAGAGSSGEDGAASGSVKADRSAGTSRSGSGAPDGDSKDPAKPSAGEPAAKKEGGEEAAPKGKHRGEKAREDDTVVSDEAGIERESGRHASRGDGPARDDAAGAEGAGRADGTYTVRTGDNLTTIADAHDVRGGWTALYAGNEETVGSDPDLITPGQRLDLG